MNVQFYPKMSLEVPANAVEKNLTSDILQPQQELLSHLFTTFKWPGSLTNDKEAIDFALLFLTNGYKAQET